MRQTTFSFFSCVLLLAEDIIEVSRSTLCFDSFIHEQFWFEYYMRHLLDYLLLISVAVCVLRNLEYRRLVNRAEDLYLQVTFPTSSCLIVW
jgi:hypothetical protein